MRWHCEFEWDGDKARANLRKHRVSFHDAARVLGDEEGDVYHIVTTPRERTAYAKEIGKK